MRSKNSEKSKKRSAVAAPKRRSASAKSASSSQSPRSSPSRVVVGLDLSLTATGVVVWDGNRCQRKRRYKTAPVGEHTDGLKLPPRGQRAPDLFIGDDEERIDWIKKKIRATIRKFPPDLVVIEGHAFGAQSRGKTVLAELHGVIKNLLFRMDIPFVVKTPQSIKKHMTGDGRASKMDMIYAAKQFDRDISDSDTADAFGCAKLGHDCWKDLVE